LLGFAVWRFRKSQRHAGLFGTLAILVISLGAMMASGCGGSISQNSAPPGTYVIQVFGVGDNTNVTQYQSVTLTITK
jgi:hypothetical protein